MKSLPILKKYSVKASKLEFQPITDELLQGITNDIGIYIFVISMIIGMLIAKKYSKLF